jgi:hypothetical protein
MNEDVTAGKLEISRKFTTTARLFMLDPWELF